MKTILKIFMIMLIVVSLIGCHPRPLHKVKSDMYSGPDRSRDEIVTIKGDGHQIYWGLFLTSSLAEIHMVDGEVVKTGITDFYSYPYNWAAFDADEVRVLPGNHEVVVRILKSLVSGSYGGLFEINPETRLLIFNFDAKAGHTYKVDVPIRWEKNSIIKVIDEGTKEIVDSKVVD